MSQLAQISTLLGRTVALFHNICISCSKERSQCEGSFEYPLHIFWLRNKKIFAKIHTLIWRPGLTHLTKTVIFQHASMAPVIPVQNHVGPIYAESYKLQVIVKKTCN